MKKSFLTAVFVLFVGSLIFADGNLAAGKFGIFAQSDVYNGTVNEVSLLDSYQMGGEYFITDNISIKPGLIWGSTEDIDTPDGVDEYTSNENSMFGGFLAGLYYHQLAKGLYFFGGPGIGYVTEEETDYNANEDKTDYDKTTTLMVDGIFGAKYLFNSYVALSIETGFRYSNGDDKDDDFTLGVKTGSNEYVTKSMGLLKPSICLSIYLN